MQKITPTEPNRDNGDSETKVNLPEQSEFHKIKTLSGTVNLGWVNEDCTIMGGVLYFSEFLDSTKLFDEFVEGCLLEYKSNNAPSKRDILGIIVLSILSGHNRYAHINRLRSDSLCRKALRLENSPSEDSVRRACSRIVMEDESSWIASSFDRLSIGVLSEAWIMDIDVTIKPIYGNQEGATIGYNPKKPGRPSHSYHSIWVGKLRMCLGVQVCSGNESASKHGLEFVLEWLNRHSKSEWPRYIRGDIGYGTERWMKELETLSCLYLFKLKQTPNIKRLIAMSEVSDDWIETLDNWECLESTIRLDGWSNIRRVVIYRRSHKKPPVVAQLPQLEGPVQEEFLPIQLIDEEDHRYEYSVYVTNMKIDKKLIGPSYRERGDNENCYDELKNQWGWGGFTVQDLKRCQLMASLVAIVYNWWSLYVKFIDHRVARESITSKPLFLNNVARSSINQSQQKIRIHSSHSESDQVQELLMNGSKRLRAWMSDTAEQLKETPILSRIITHILTFHETLGDNRIPPLLSG